jgi:hypothetical protein
VTHARSIECNVQCSGPSFTGCIKSSNIRTLVAFFQERDIARFRTSWFTRGVCRQQYLRPYCWPRSAMAWPSATARQIIQPAIKLVSKRTPPSLRPLSNTLPSILKFPIEWIVPDHLFRLCVCCASGWQLLVLRLRTG